jgi:long-subunit fatty acid transport protein
MKFRTFITLLLTTGSTAVVAGGFETTALSTSFMYESGSYGEASMSSRTYDITGTVYAPTGSAVKNLSKPAFAVKSDIFDNLAIGLSSYNQGAVQLDYSGAGAVAALAAGLPVVDLTIDALTLQAKYDYSKNIALIAGIKNTTVQDASAFIFAAAGLPATTITGGSEMGYIVGASYSIPEIAFRAELLYETETNFSLDSTNANAAAVGLAVAGKTTGSIPDYMTLNFQSGVADGTLVFGSMRRADWSNHQLMVHPQSAVVGNPLGGPTSSFTNTTTINVGVGRKVTDSLSLIGTYGTEAKGDAAGTSLLSMTNGYQGITIAGRYTLENATITAGYNYTMFGDKTVTPPAGAAGSFTGNKVTGFGIKVGFSF